jgi:hypothetical protein
VDQWSDHERGGEGLLRGRGGGAVKPRILVVT